MKTFIRAAKKSLLVSLAVGMFFSGTALAAGNEATEQGNDVVAAVGKGELKQAVAGQQYAKESELKNYVRREELKGYAKTETMISVKDILLFGFLPSMAVSVGLFAVGNSQGKKQIRRLQEKMQDSRRNNPADKDIAWQNKVTELSEQIDKLQQDNSQLRERLDKLERDELKKEKQPIESLSDKPKTVAAAAEIFVDEDGLRSEDKTKIQGFVNSYNSLQAVPPTNGRPKSKAREDFVRNYDLQGFACTNEEAVAVEKQVPEFGSVTGNPDFYGLQLKDDLFAVVPSLWKRRTGMQINLFGFGHIFNVSADEEGVYNQVQVENAALFVRHGDVWTLKRSGQARIS